MKHLILNCLLFVALPIAALGQSITLDECQTKAKANYPLVKQYNLIEQTAQYNISCHIACHIGNHRKGGYHFELFFRPGR